MKSHSQAPTIPDPGHGLYLKSHPQALFPPDPAHCLYLARGLGRLFWGLLAAMAFFFAGATVVVSERVSLPAYVLGAALALWGARTLRLAGPLTPRWLFLVRAASALLALAIYFAPFLQWWKARPESGFLLANTLAFVTVAILALAFINLLCLAAGRRLGHRGFRIESGVCLAAVILLLVLPFAAVVAGAAFLAEYNLSTFPNELRGLVARLPDWAVPLALAPCSLALVNLWKGRDLSHACLLGATAPAADRAQGPEAPPCG
jgi:hypothetical protein